MKRHHPLFERCKHRCSVSATLVRGKRAHLANLKSRSRRRTVLQRSKRRNTDGPWALMVCARTVRAAGDHMGTTHRHHSAIDLNPSVFCVVVVAQPFGAACHAKGLAQHCVPSVKIPFWWVTRSRMHPSLTVHAQNPHSRRAPTNNTGTITKPAGMADTNPQARCFSPRTNAAIVPPM